MGGNLIDISNMTNPEIAVIYIMMISHIIFIAFIILIVVKKLAKARNNIGFILMSIWITYSSALITEGFMLYLLQGSDSMLIPITYCEIGICLIFMIFITVKYLKKRGEIINVQKT